MKRWLLVVTLLVLALAQAQQNPSSSVQALLAQAEQFAAQARTQNVPRSPDSTLWRQAIQKAEEATRADPASSEAWRLLATYYSETRFWIRADEAWSQYLRRGTPDERTSQQIAQVQMNLGYAAYGQENLEAAAARFQSAAEFDPRSAAPLEWQGRIALEQGNVGAARAFYQRANQLQPGDTNRYFLNLTQNVQSYGREATRAFLEAYDTYQAGQREQALQGFAEAARAAPQWSEAQRWVGRLQLELNRPAQALTTWQQLAATAGSTASDRYFLRFAQLANQNGTPAARAFLDGVNAFDLNRAAALTFFQQATAASPNFAEAWYWLGRSAFETRNYGQAVDAYSRVLQLQPDNREAQYWLGQARRALGQ
ncbi:MAG: tetratricopeptide repeat protein [Meiothermus sp.]|nr:tetratricopeptide repeat protein [Meiothermus sp.]